VISYSRRGTELGLVVLAAFITGAAYVLASLGKSASLPADIGPFLLAILGLLGLAHVVVRRLAPAADGTLLPIAGLLNGIGYVFIARLDPDLAGLQATWTAVGVGAFCATLYLVRDSRDLERYRYTFALVGIGLLLMPLVPGLGRLINGARLWVRIGPVTFQPGEFAKIALAVFFASYLVERAPILRDFGRGKLPDARSFGPIVLAWMASLVVMIAERDLGSSLLFFAFFIAMLWMATDRAIFVGIGSALFAFGAVVSYQMFSHVQSRVTIWLDPWASASGAGFQIVQALFALGSGGFTGTGISLGSPSRMPAATTDLIFAAIGEELGLLGTTALLTAFLLMIGAGLRIAVRAERPFDQLLAAGLTTILGFQTFIIVGGVTRLIPLTGITLPFVSYGGSSLVANYVLLALLLRVSDRQTRARAGRDHEVVTA
jgi:cell division protein FtsW (lipid II flippase)